MLYYTTGFFTPAGAANPCASPQPDTLYTIDPTTGNTTVIGPVTVSGSNVNEFIGSSYVGGKLYGFTISNPDQEYSIDLTSGVATLVNSTAVAIGGAGSSQ
jgi:hypothetical protein